MQSVNCFGNTIERIERMRKRIASVRGGEAVRVRRIFFCWQLKHLQGLRSPRLSLSTKEPLLYSGATTAGVY
jgi:hypothetical protein